MRYYSTQRPISPGAFPKPAGNKVLNCVNFDGGRTFCREIGRTAYGYIEYERPISIWDADSYELTKGIA